MTTACKRGVFVLLVPIVGGCTDLLGADFDRAALAGSASGDGSGGGAVGGAGGAGGTGGAGGSTPDDALWARWFGSRATVDYGDAVAIDAAGNVYVAGNFGGSDDLGCTPNKRPTVWDLFVAKLDPAGACLWMIVSGGGLVGEMALAPDGSVVVAGAYSGNPDFGGGPIGAAGAEQIFLARLSGDDGSHLGSWSYGTGAKEYASGLAVGPDGSMYLSGHYTGPTNLGSGPATALEGSNGTADAFVFKVDASGAPVWARGFPAYASEDALVDLAVTEDGTGVFAGGRFWGLATFDGIGLQAKGEFDGLVLRLHADTGAVQWASSFGGVVDDQVFGLAARDDVLFVTGWFHGDVDFGNDFDLVSDGEEADAFLAELHAGDGHTNWAARFGGSRTDGGFGVAVAPDGDVVVSGEFRDTVDFAGETLVARGDQDVFVLRLPANHNSWNAARWARRYGATAIVVAPTEERGRDVAVGPDGSIAVTGSFGETVKFGATTLTSLGYNDAFVALLPP